MKTMNEAERLAHDHRELRDATPRSGTVVRATVDTLGAIKGIGAAGLLGSLMGALGGLMLDREGWYAGERERELDRTGGATTPDLIPGAPPRKV